MSAAGPVPPSCLEMPNIIPCLPACSRFLCQVRMEPLGSDRRYNKYWRFVLLGPAGEEAAGRAEGQVRTEGVQMDCGLLFSCFGQLRQRSVLHAAGFGGSSK